MPEPIQRRGEWWQETATGSWLRWSESESKWVPEGSPPPPPDSAPHQTSRSAVGTSQPVGMDLERPEWAIRAGAAIVDVLLAIAVLGFSAWVIELGNLWNWLIWVVVIGGSLVWIENYDQELASPGGKLFNIQVVDARTGVVIGSGKAFTRWLVSIGMWAIPLLGLANALWPLWDRNQETLHDKMFGTAVVVARDAKASMSYAVRCNKCGLATSLSEPTGACSCGGILV